MPLFIVLSALLIGVLGVVDVGGREFTISGIDLVAFGVAIAGTVVAVHRRRLRLDIALVAYVLVLGVAGLQLIAFDGDLGVLGGATRFAVPLALVWGLSQLLAPMPPGAEPATVPLGWARAVGFLGTLLGAWVVALFVRGVADPELTRFYDIKNGIDVPLGASNYLAAFLLVATCTSALLARRDAWLWPAATVSGLGLAATMSRGALLALVGAAVVAGLVVGSRRVVAWVPAGVVVAVVAVVVAAGGIGPALGQAPAEGEEVSPIAQRLRGALAGETAGRQHLISSAWRGFTSSPIHGVGFNRVDEWTSREGHAGHPNVHNLVLHSLVTTGLLGSVPYLALWVLLALRIARTRPPAERLALAVGVGALVLHAQIEALAYTRAIEALVAVLLVVTGVRSGDLGVREVGRGAVAARSTLDEPTADQRTPDPTTQPDDAPAGAP